MAKAFIDTNVLFYACDADAGIKQSQAKALLREKTSGSDLCTSTQVLQEFFVSATRKLQIPPLQVKDIIYSLRSLEITVIDPDDINRAIDGHILWQVSFWDAIIITAAQKLRCPILYTEDLNHGQIYDSVKVVNPFKALASCSLPVR